MMSHWKVTANYFDESDGRQISTQLEIWNEGLHAAIGTLEDLAPRLLSPREGGDINNKEFTSLTLTRESLPEDLLGTGKRERESEQS